MKIAILVQPIGADDRIDQIDSLDQAKEVLECVVALGHEGEIVTYADHGSQSAANLAAANPDVVFNLVEEVPEGTHNVHLATALLDRLGLSYTGARTAQLEALGDKRAMKRRLAAAGLPVIAVLGEAPDDARFIVKSAIEHGSVGIEPGNVVQGADAARRMIAERTAKFGGEWFAEAYVDGREFDVAILGTPEGPRVLPVAEICWPDHKPGDLKVFGFTSKWIIGSPEADEVGHIFPPHEPIMATLAALARDAWNAFELTGFAHVDFRVDPEGNPFILEINANPCILRSAGFCKAAGKVGMSQSDVVAALVQAAR